MSQTTASNHSCARTVTHSHTDMLNIWSHWQSWSPIGWLVPSQFPSRLWGLRDNFHHPVKHPKDKQTGSLESLNVVKKRKKHKASCRGSQNSASEEPQMPLYAAPICLKDRVCIYLPQCSYFDKISHVAVRDFSLDHLTTCFFWPVHNEGTQINHPLMAQGNCSHHPPFGASGLVCHWGYHNGKQHKWANLLGE